MLLSPSCTSLFSQVWMRMTNPGSYSQRRWWFCLFFFLSNKRTWLVEIYLAHDSYLSRTFDEFSDRNCTSSTFHKAGYNSLFKLRTIGKTIKLELIALSAARQSTTWLRISSTAPWAGLRIPLLGSLAVVLTTVFIVFWVTPPLDTSRYFIFTWAWWNRSSFELPSTIQAICWCQLDTCSSPDTCRLSACRSVIEGFFVSSRMKMRQLFQKFEKWVLAIYAAISLLALEHCMNQMSVQYEEQPRGYSQQSLLLGYDCNLSMLNNI